jgi:8-oxo-dGTP pyrophosphatase MutT (NUDIX family)
MQPGDNRRTARVILCKANQQIFLLNTHFDPEVGLGPRWLTPGGGIDPGETIQQAALRELFEETGLKLEPEQLGELVWQSQGRWDWADGVNFHTYEDYFYLVRLERLGNADFILDDSGWTVDEHRDVLEHRWWDLTELKDSGEPVGPPDLISFLGDNLQG